MRAFAVVLPLSFLCSSLPSQSPVQKLVSEFDRLAVQPLWPGFSPGTTPLAIYDRDSTWLIRHPAPPPEFQPVPGWPTAMVMPGQHASVRANTNVQLGGAATATLLMPGSSGPPNWTRLAGTLIHEAFHVYQARFPRWHGNEVEFFTYPVTDTVLQRLQRLETEAWRRAAAPTRSQVCWARVALGLRQERFARLSPGATRYERGNELNESLATWVQTKATRAPVESLVPAAGFAPDGVRLRAYSVGPVLAYLLDKHQPGWPARLEADTNASLDQLLASALPRARCEVGFQPAETDSATALAAREIVALVAARQTRLREFSGRRGWTLTIAAAANAPLWPQRFDPWNVTPLDAHLTLHQRWVRLGNEAGEIEVLNRDALTVGIGDHPLFTGVQRLIITGLDSMPAIHTDSLGTAVQAPGVTGRFKRVEIDTTERQLVIRVR